MRILLTTAPWSYEELEGDSPKKRKKIGLTGILPNLGLLYIASNLKKYGHEVHYVEGFFSSEKDIIHIIKTNDIEVVGVSCVSCMWPKTKKLIAILKKEYPLLFIVVGGKHPNYWKQKCLMDCKELDAVVYGEGEKSFLELIEKRKRSGIIRGTIVRKDDMIIVNPPRKKIDINKIPFPLFNLIEFNKYEPNLSLLYRKPFMYIISSRGCFLNCNFCKINNEFSLRNYENICAEMELLVKGYGVKTINFYDDYNIFSEDKQQAINLCNSLISKKINVNWSICLEHFNIEDYTLRMMKRAGCFRIQCPIESGVQKNRDPIKSNNINLNYIKECINLIKKNKIEAYARFMIGTPNESVSESLRTIKFAKKINPDYASFVKVFLFSDVVFKKLLRRGYINKSLEHRSLYSKDFYKSNKISDLRIKLLIIYAYVIFYADPVFILKKILNVNQYLLFLNYAKRFLFK